MGSLIWTDNYSNQFIPEEIRNYSKNKSKFLRLLLHGFEGIIWVYIELTQILTLFQEEWYRVFEEMAN
ncbi:hypothetical protein BpHYR1_029839 [Brachionus plicatilis]|uniref:Uncharacterized protein n=1 Tax=Brachionus plicatilis TaxID=10195 RepID=A0A3M7PZ58_BRAPC|nr:hypothetical protein BpHYR1_029839 [Brachionus plicatilis]